MAGPSEAAVEALLALDRTTRRLRLECPWDRAQDERSIVPHTVEEAYELADAAHAGDDDKLTDELGDVLFQVHFLSLLLEERGAGNLEDVARAVTQKLVRRHPHVFGDASDDPLAELPTQARTPAEVRANWDAIKTTEASAQQASGTVPELLPALTYARKLKRRSAASDARLDPTEAVAAVSERLAETGEAIDRERSLERGGVEHGSDLAYRCVGELLMASVELARTLEVDPEVALRLAANRLAAGGEAGTGASATEAER
jgi:XTP/dITP diphosphohydrolase/tetrapyrrole methylase family protein/MazG family protein/ATP diphosphatase